MPFPLDQSLAIAVSWGHVALIGLYYLTAWGFHHLARWLSRFVVRLQRFSQRRGELAPWREETLRGLIGGATSFAAFLVATLASLSLFIDATTLLWIVGLFSAAFGLGARPIVSDFLQGASFIFEDTFGVGEKVEISVAGGPTVEGIIEAVNLRATLVRASSGELITVPNGEIRVVRNFTRGRFSRGDVTLRIAASDLGEAIPLLEALGEEAVSLLPNLLEPWRVISEAGEMGQQAGLTLVAKARFGNAAEMRPRLLALVQERLEQAGIALSG